VGQRRSQQTTKPADLTAQDLPTRCRSVRTVGDCDARGGEDISHGTTSPFPRIDEFFVLHRHCGVDSVDVWPDPEIEAPGLHRLHTRCAVCGAVESELIRVSAIEAYRRALEDDATLIRAMAEAERRIRRH